VLDAVINAPQLHPGTVNEEEILTSLVPIIQELENKYGPPFALLENPARAAGADKENVCNMAYDMYERILKLPDTESATILRMFSAAM